MSYNIIFYEDSEGVSEVWNLLEELRKNLIQSKMRAYNISKSLFVFSFYKKTQKTPKREITKAKAERDRFLSRKGDFNT